MKLFAHMPSHKLVTALQVCGIAAALLTPGGLGAVHRRSAHAGAPARGGIAAARDRLSIDSVLPELRWLLIPGAVAMHIGVRLAMGLDYSAQWLTLVIVFVNWPLVVWPGSGAR